MLGNYQLEVHQVKQLQCHRNLCLTWLIESSVKQGRIAKTDTFDKQIGVNMNTEQLRRKARQLYNNKLVPEGLNQYNQRKWVRSVLRLGDKYLLAKKVERVQ